MRPLIAACRPRRPGGETAGRTRGEDRVGGPRGGGRRHGQRHPVGPRLRRPRRQSPKKGRHSTAMPSPTVADLTPTGRAPDIAPRPPGSGGRVVMQRTANPRMWVRFPPGPPSFQRLGWAGANSSRASILLQGAPAQAGSFCRRAVAQVSLRSGHHDPPPAGFRERSRWQKSHMAGRGRGPPCHFL